METVAEDRKDHRDRKAAEVRVRKDLRELRDQPDLKAPLGRREQAEVRVRKETPDLKAPLGRRERKAQAGPSHRGRRFSR